MKLNLSRPICVFDMEATGPHPVKDKLLKLSISKVFPDGNRTGIHTLLNPGIPIPAEATAEHGITDEMVKNAPTFIEISQSLLEFISGSDFIGYNWYISQLSILVEEFHRAGLPNPVAEASVIDPLRIFMRKEKSTLAALLKFYCGEELEENETPHRPTNAIVRILQGQLERYQDLPNDIQKLSSLSHGEEFVDFWNFIVYKNGKNIYNWGGLKGKPVKDDLYSASLLHKPIPEETKRHVRRIMGREESEDEEDKCA